MGVTSRSQYRVKMDLQWTRKALSDLARLHVFLEPVNPAAAARTVQQLTKAPTRLLDHPRIGERLEQFNPREVRRIFVADYEMRYAIKEHTLYILRVWHSRENR